MTSTDLSALRDGHRIGREQRQTSPLDQNPERAFARQRDSSDRPTPSGVVEARSLRNYRRRYVVDRRPLRGREIGFSATAIDQIDAANVVQFSPELQ